MGKKKSKTSHTTTSNDKIEHTKASNTQKSKHSYKNNPSIINNENDHTKTHKIPHETNNPSKTEKDTDNQSQNQKQKTETNKKSAISEIDDLFNQKKQYKNEQKAQEQQEKERIKQHKASIPKDRNDLSNINKKEWIDDGLGGVFNHEGFTGRRHKEDGFNVKVYKAHLMNKPGFGNSKDCPFDCDCCYI